MLPLYTEVPVRPGNPRWSPPRPALFVGSCFTEHIGGYFAKHGFPALVNPAGIVFDIFSCVETLNMLLDLNFHPEPVQTPKGWADLRFHGHFAHQDKSTAEKLILQSITAVRSRLTEISHLFITPGTAHYFMHKATGKPVANCHKLPASDFERKLGETAEITEKFSEVLGRWKKSFPQCTVVVSISPVKHLRDGLQAASLSKAILRAAIYPFEKNQEIQIFPAYEILTEELRDYRFYANDMSHPSELAISIIRDKFIQNWLDASCLPALKAMESLRKMEHHLPLQPENIQIHQQQINEKKQQILTQYSWLS